MKAIFALFLFIAAGYIAFIYFFYKPVNLNVTYVQSDLASVNKKLNVVYEPLPPGLPPEKTIIFSGFHQVNTDFTEKEITAAADNRYKNYAYFPFRQVQIRINSDGTVEASARAGLTETVKYLVRLGVRSDMVDSAIKKFNIPNAVLPVYMKVKGAVTGNKSKITVEAVTISRLPVPQYLIKKYGPLLNTLVDSVIADRRPSYDIKKLEVKSDKIHFEGSAPDREYAVKKL